MVSTEGVINDDPVMSFGHAHLQPADAFPRSRLAVSPAAANRICREESIIKAANHSLI